MHAFWKREISPVGKITRNQMLSISPDPGAQEKTLPLLDRLCDKRGPQGMTNHQESI